jgi:hypothetical protein
MKISPYTIYLEMQPNALLVRQNFIICKKWVLHLHPFGEIVHDGQNVLVTLDGWRVDFADHVHALASEWPRFHDGIHY